MYLNADLISGTGAAEWARVRGTGSSKHEANSYYEFATRLSIRTLRLVNVPEFTSVFHTLIQITSTWSLGHSRLFPAVVHFVVISCFFHVISKSIRVMCPSRAWKFVEAEPVLTRQQSDAPVLYVLGDALSASNITEVKISPHNAFLFRPQDAMESIQTARFMYHLECRVDKLTWPWYGNSDSGVL